MCRYFPFLAHSQPTLFSKIQCGDYSFPTDYWGDVSAVAKDFIRALVVVAPGARLKTKDALRHPWITEYSCAPRAKLHSSHRAFLLIRKLPFFSDVRWICPGAVGPPAALDIVDAQTLEIVDSQSLLKCAHSVGPACLAGPRHCVHRAGPPAAVNTCDSICRRC